jgi:hypothetical protein
MGGWDQVRGRLQGDEDGRPMLVFFDTCIHSIRTMPALQHDEAGPKISTPRQEDHAADMVRYGCMSRPWIRKPPEASCRSRARSGPAAAAADAVERREDQNLMADYDDDDRDRDAGRRLEADGPT